MMNFTPLWAQVIIGIFFGLLIYSIIAGITVGIFWKTKIFDEFTSSAEESAVGFFWFVTIWFGIAKIFINIIKQ